MSGHFRQTFFQCGICMLHGCTCGECARAACKENLNAAVRKNCHSHDHCNEFSTFTHKLIVLHIHRSACVALCAWGRGTPLPPCPFTSSSFPPFYFSLSFIGFTYFLLLSIPSLSTRIVKLRFQAGGRRSRPNLGLVFFVLYFVLSVFLS